VLIVEKTAIGYVLAEANGKVVYTYGKDTKGGNPACTGSCAAIWPPVTGKPVASTADTLPGTLDTVSDANGAKQITYNGLPLYTFKGAKAFVASGNGLGGEWHAIKLSASDITAGG
jgi:predicted lipoprotein with Yx(FWY)xxD motif